MITLNTLSQATAQEVFDQAAVHMLTQGKRSHLDGHGCQYRHQELKCAGGCFISDDQYDKKNMEGRGWKTLRDDHLVPSDHSQLIAELQRLHDCVPPHNWRSTLLHFAVDKNLDPAVLDSYEVTA